jgi:hypothetical protein
MKIFRLTGMKRSARIPRFSMPKFARVSVAAATLAGYLFTYAVASATPIISQGFLTSSEISPGSIVSLQKNSTDYVDAATTSNANNILGVVIDGSHPPVSITSDQSNQVQVATNGVEKILVSDINGSISSGDSITASPISGVGMKATSNTKVVGIAQDNFPNSTSKKQSYKDKSGKQHSVNLGELSVLVNVSDYFKQPEKTLIPQAIQNIANALAGKKVDSLPILISIGIFIVTLIVVVSIIYAMIHSSIISVGRNPMSQAAVYRNVLQLSVLVVVILMVAVASIYMVLRKF